MAKTNTISYKVFLFERVKKKLRFFETDTYPLQIRLTAGARTLYLKSNFFNLAIQNKYQEQAILNKQKISISDIIYREEELMNFILKKESAGLSLDMIRREYSFFSRDILNQPDEQFKTFLVDFFYAENLPFYSLFIKNDGANHTSEFILNDLEKSLQTPMFEKLLKTAAQKAPPYIPLIKFYRETINNPLPVFPVYLWELEPVKNNFPLFIQNHFPEYKNRDPENYINAFIR